MNSLENNPLNTHFYAVNANQGHREQRALSRFVILSSVDVCPKLKKKKVTL